MPGTVADTTGARTLRLEAIFDAHYDRLYRLARRLTASREDALDLVQDAFVRAAGSWKAIPCGHSAEEAWLVRVLVNLQRDAWRRARVRKEYRKRHSNERGTEPVSAGTAASTEEAHVARATVQQALAALSPRRRAVLVMHELEGVSVGTVASALGISRITVRWHLSRGRNELAAALHAQESGR